MKRKSWCSLDSILGLSSVKVKAVTWFWNKWLGIAKRVSPTRFGPACFWLALNGSGWAGPTRQNGLCFWGTVRRLVSWRADPPSFSWYVYFVVQNQILIFFISNLVDWILSQYINVLVVTIIIVRVVCICINTIQ